MDRTTHFGGSNQPRHRDHHAMVVSVSQTGRWTTRWMARSEEGPRTSRTLTVNPSMPWDRFHRRIAALVPSEEASDDHETVEDGALSEGIDQEHRG
jgi:hypothetical protein